MLRLSTVAVGLCLIAALVAVATGTSAAKRVHVTDKAALAAPAHPEHTGHGSSSAPLSTSGPSTSVHVASTAGSAAILGKQDKPKVTPPTGSTTTAPAVTTTTSPRGPSTTTTGASTATTTTTEAEADSSGAVSPWRGAGLVSLPEDCADIATLGLSWYYNWWTDPQCAGSGVPFVPMMWGDWCPTDTGCSTLPTHLASEGSPYLLTFNEPDNPDQSNMTVARALQLWPYLEATGLQLSSPAVTDTPQGTA